MVRRRYACPECDWQGWIERYRIRVTGAVIWLCGECDSLWLEEAEIPNPERCRSLRDVMAEQGLPELWDRIEPA